jgi:hypothetical protein
MLVARAIYYNNKVQKIKANQVGLSSGFFGDKNDILCIWTKVLQYYPFFMKIQQGRPLTKLINIVGHKHLRITYRYLQI